MVTWIDVIVVIICLLYVFDGYRQGFLKEIADLIGIVVSFIVALKFYNIASTVFVSWGLNPGFAKPIGFFALWTMIQIIFYLLISVTFRYVPELTHQSRLNKYSGTVPGFLKGVMIVGVFLIIIMVLPFSGSLKNKLSSSLISGHLIKATAKVENQMETVLGQLNNTLTFVGTKPTSEDELTKLDFSTNEISVDEASEKKMLELVNEARQKAGVKPLEADILIRNVARAHSMDMSRNGYFSHVNLQGQSPFDRMMQAGVSFRSAGENLALAPTIEIANIGLMNSPEHRDNILDPEFGRIGIGVIDAGYYGKMVTQNFAN